MAVCLARGPRPAAQVGGPFPVLPPLSHIVPAALGLGLEGSVVVSGLGSFTDSDNITLALGNCTPQAQLLPVAGPWALSGTGAARTLTVTPLLAAKVVAVCLRRESADGWTQIGGAIDVGLLEYALSPAEVCGGVRGRGTRDRRCGECFLRAAGEGQLAVG